MFKLHFFLKESKGKQKIIQLISNFLYIYSSYEFDEKPNYTEISKFLNFEGKDCKEKDYFC
jgi:hypothetical protein